MIRQPYYMIDFSATACMFEIRINDVAIIILNVKSQAAAMIPINYAILQSGKQQVSIKILPILGETMLNKNAALKYDVKLFDTENDFKFQKVFGNYKIPEIDTNSNLPFLAHDDFFTAELPYNITAWKNSKKLKNNDDTKKALIKAYQELINILKDQKYNDFKEKISKRESIMATTMYLSKSESNARVNNIINDLEKGFKIQELPSESIMFLYANGKTAALRRPNGEPALYAYNAETKEELMIDIAFHLTSEKSKLEII